jgi:hypothetical protein
MIRIVFTTALLFAATQAQGQTAADVARLTAFVAAGPAARGGAPQLVPGAATAGSLASLLGAGADGHNRAPTQVVPGAFTAGTLAWLSRPGVAAPVLVVRTAANR